MSVFKCWEKLRFQSDSLKIAQRPVFYNRQQQATASH